MIPKLAVIAYNHIHSIPNPAAPMRFSHGLRLRLLVGLITLMFTGQEAGASDAAELRALAERKLHESLKADSVYVRVHAAEALISEGLVQRARDSFLAEALAAEMVPIRRVVTWRVLAQVATDAQQRERWINRLKAVALDPATEDRTHAVESLDELHVDILPVRLVLAFPDGFGAVLLDESEDIVSRDPVTTDRSMVSHLLQENESLFKSRRDRVVLVPLAEGIEYHGKVRQVLESELDARPVNAHAVRRSGVKRA